METAHPCCLDQLDDFRARLLFIAADQYVAIEPVTFLQVMRRHVLEGGHDCNVLPEQLLCDLPGTALGR